MQARDILRRVRLVLADSDFVRWSLPELVLWLSDAQREIAVTKPNAVTRTMELPLVEGTKQSHDHIALVRVMRNIAVSATPGPQVAGKAITAIKRETLDAVMPSWGDTQRVPPARQVDHVIQDMMEPRTFYVVPANDGTGLIEAVLAVYPADIGEPATGSALDMDSYTQTLDVPEIYRGALVDFVLYRAFSKDSEDPSNANRAQAHWNQFQTAMGAKVTAETAARLGTTGDTE